MRRFLRGLAIAVLLAAAVSAFGQQGGEAGKEATDTQRQIGVPTANQLDSFDKPADLFDVACASCHGIEGQGDFGPAFPGNMLLQSTQYVVQQILHGGGGMPAFGPPQLSEEQVAALATLIRTTWGNDFGAVTVADVQQIRDAGN
jgi:mono/diheme cytochrome c family protein